MTRAQWDDSINLMIRRHNMPPLDDEDRDVVLNYLEAAYPPCAPTGRLLKIRNLQIQTDAGGQYA